MGGKAVILHRHGNIWGQIEIKQGKSLLEGGYIDVSRLYLQGLRRGLIADDDP